MGGVGAAVSEVYAIVDVDFSGKFDKVEGLPDGKKKHVAAAARFSDTLTSEITTSNLLLVKFLQFMCAYVGA